MTTDLTPQEPETLIEFPCDYKLKAMGKHCETFVELVYQVTLKHAPETPRENIEMTDSKGKKFVSVNITFRATCIQQVHSVYGDLKKHPEVLMTL